MVFLINVLVCDDNKDILKQISKLLSSWSKKHNVTFHIDCKTSGDFVFKENKQYDLAFIDIELPGISGLKLAEKLKENTPDIIIIVITSFQNYLDSAMKIRVFRYLNKPIEPNRFNSNLLEAIHEYRSISKTIVIEQKDKIFFLKTKDILYIENLKYGSVIITKDNEYKTNKKPEEWYKIINQPNCFVYSHNSYIVNLQNISSFSKTNVYFKRTSGDLITAHISQRKYSNFKKAFFSFAGGLR